MEMLNAGVISIMIADDWKAKIWAQVLPKITVTNLAIREAGHSGWAMRKHSPELKVEVMDFYINNIQKLHVLQSRLVAFNKQIKQIADNTADKDWQRFEQLQLLFEKYGDKYGFDPLMLAAQGYQESTLKQEKRGPSGAIGVMQVLPSTASSLKVGDIKQLEPNIHAGSKYLDELMSRYFSDANFQGDDRTLFSFASYNAGPGTINRMRKEAVNRGLDPDRWFNQVELVVADKVGWETTTYVRNIYKYYVAYKLQLEVAEHQRQARASVAMGN
jgi:membrane-bound lytic murein transglycosylase MltF